MPVQEQEMILAPAAGAGIGKIVADELLSRDIGKKLADALERGLTATRRTWDSGVKQWVEEPDTRSQLQAAMGIMAHMEGEPVKRIIHQHLGGAGGPNLQDALRESPELQAALAKELEKAQWRHSGRQEHKKPRKVSPAAEPAADGGPAGKF